MRHLLLLIAFLALKVLKDLIDLGLRHLLNLNFIRFSTTMGMSNVTLTLYLRCSYGAIYMVFS